MKNLIVPICMGLLSMSFTLLPANKAAELSGPSSAHKFVSGYITSDASTIVYESAGLEEAGLSRDAFNLAWKGYQKLLKRKKIARSEYLTICDFSQSSKKKRFYIIDVEKQELVRNTWVAHGKNSGAEFATRFSNRAESLQSSLGFYTTSSTYQGKHGLSLMLNGMDPGFNDKALRRHVVIHGADYLGEQWLKGQPYSGRSWGCPALPKNESADIITTIKNGTCLFIYHPSRHYVKSSKILND